MENMKRLFLLDAYALIYRAYYAFMRMPRINSKGMNTSAIFGFVNTLDDVLTREKPSHLAVVFDPSGPTFRHEAYEQYKANREATPEDIKLAVPIIKQIVVAHRIPVIEVPGYEADDVIGTLAGLAEKEGFEVLMMTPDKDYGQLVTERIKIYKPRFGGSGFDTLGVAEVLEKWGLESTTQVIDLLGLMGDASDNIPGCPGVGEKTAVKLLQQFGGIDNMLEHTDEIKGALRAKVEANVEQIRFSKFLATIKTDVPVEFDEARFVIEEPDVKALVAIYEELEFRSHIKKLNAQFTMHNAQSDNSGMGSLFDNAQFTMHNSQLDIPLSPADSSPDLGEQLVGAQLSTFKSQLSTDVCVDTEEKQRELVDRLLGVKMFAFDTETTSLDALDAELVGMSFAIFYRHEIRDTRHEISDLSDNSQFPTAYYVPVSADRAEAQKTVDLFRAVFENEAIEKTGHNIKYDLMVLANYGVELKGRLFDTIIAHYLLQPELRHSMDYLAEILLKYKTIHIDELIGAKGKNQGSMRDVPLEKISIYAAEDADITLRLREVLEPQIEEMGLQELFYDVEMPLVWVLAEMERTGVLIDDFALAQSSGVMTAEMQRIERNIREISGANINLSSPKQVGELLFDVLKISDKARKTSKGQYVTDEETLEALRSKHPVVGEILEYRGVKKLLSTYIDALPKLINARTGRVHTSFNQTVTATGRLSSSNPNLQNIPIRDEQGKEIRKAFIASEGRVFMSADYSQVELRLMAHLSQDKNMLAAFNADHDIHAATAANIYKVPIEAVTSDMRRKAKTANFGIIYGISIFGLSERLGVSRAEAKELIDGYFMSFPGVKDYIDTTIENARRDGYVETLLHRRRYLPDINSRNANVRGYAERNAVNAPIQGTAADIIKIAMVKIADRLKREGLKTEMLLQVHDELNFNVPLDEVDRVKALVREEMEGAFSLSVPLRVDIGVGANWLEAH
ncbi:MAG: DNA polymerase I [Paludibacteraceae bacterium]|nr:DNA polymerase I [Paludibacteraceae bacterium]